MIEIPDFVPHAPVSADTIDRYRGRVSDELIDIWQRYGYGTFADGFFKIIDPDLYLDQLGTEGIGYVPRIEGSESIPILATGLADLICWEPDKSGLAAIIFRNQGGTGIGSSLDTMFGLLKRHGLEAYATKRFDYEMYPKAVEAHGPLAYGESFMYVPLLSLGGAKDVASMQKRETSTAMRIFLEFQGPIEH